MISIRADEIKLVALGALAAIVLQLLLSYLRPTPKASPPCRRSAHTAADAAPPRTPESKLPTSGDETLKLESLRRLQGVGHAGARDLFQFVAPQIITPQLPPPPNKTPTITVPASDRNRATITPVIPIIFYGYAIRQGYQPSAFVLSGDEIYVSKPGDLIQNRYRLIGFSTKTVVVEDGATGYRHVIPILEP